MSNPPPPAPAPTLPSSGSSALSEPGARDELRNLGLWRRLHIRLTALYGGLTLLSIALLGVSSYHSDLRRELAAIRQQLQTTSVSLAVSMDGDAVQAWSALPRSAADLPNRLQLRFRNVLRRDPDIASIYLLTPTLLPTRLRFVADVVRLGASASPG